MLERVDVEAEARQRAGDALEVVLRRRIALRGEALDVLPAGGERGGRAILVEHGQRAEHLAHRLVESGEFGAHRRIAEERVERLLDGAQVRLDLGHDLRHQQAFLGAAAHLVEQRHVGHALRARCRCGTAASRAPMVSACCANSGARRAKFSTAFSTSSSAVATSIATASTTRLWSSPSQADEIGELCGELRKVRLVQFGGAVAQRRRPARGTP